MEISRHKSNRTLLERMRLAGREDQVILALALIIGVLTALAVVAFILVSERLGMRLYPAASAPWRRVLIPIVGSLGTGYLLYRYFPDARGSGVPQTKAALFARDGVIPARTVLGKFVCTSATLASGMPLGREGPSVQVGAGIASWLGRNVGLGAEQVKKLIPVGAAAAIAAAFNTPLAAVVFSLEEVMGDLHAPVMGAVVLASATAWVVLRMLLGNHPLFHVPQYQLVHPLEFAVYACLGLAGGLMSAAFTRSLAAVRAWFLSRPKSTVWVQPAAGGVVVGLLGWAVPQTMGVGYSYVGDVLNEHLLPRLILILMVLKFISVILAYASGNAGGIFGPALFLGAMLGGGVGWVAHHWLPAFTATPGAYALVGMGAVFAGIVRAPMTSVLMIFEMTQDYAVIVPLMIANLVSYFVASRIQEQPIYEVLSLQDGVHLPTAEARVRQRERQVMRVMRPAPETLPAELSFYAALERTDSNQPHTWLVMAARGVVGLITREEIEIRIAKGEGDKALAGAMEGLPFPHIHRDQLLDVALDRMGAANLDLLPVVSRANVHTLEGVVWLQDVLESYGIRSRR